MEKYHEKGNLSGLHVDNSVKDKETWSATATNFLGQLWVGGGIGRRLSTPDHFFAYQAIEIPWSLSSE